MSTFTFNPNSEPFYPSWMKKPSTPEPVSEPEVMPVARKQPLQSIIKSRSAKTGSQKTKTVKWSQTQEKLIKFEPYPQDFFWSKRDRVTAELFNDYVEDTGIDSGFDYCDDCRGIFVDDSCACGSIQQNKTYDRSCRLAVIHDANAALRKHEHSLPSRH